MTTVTDHTKLVANGITARVVYTVVREEGEVIEVRDRFAHTLESADLIRIDKHLQVLRGSVVDQTPKASEAEAARLLATLTGVASVKPG